MLPESTLQACLEWAAGSLTVSTSASGPAGLQILVRYCYKAFVGIFSEQFESALKSLSWSWEDRPFLNDH